MHKEHIIVNGRGYPDTYGWETNGIWFFHLCYYPSSSGFCVCLCMCVQIGTEFLRGVSGGERKRCSIGMELITSPSLLFLDEPTTGLDSNTANCIISLLHKYNPNMNQSHFRQLTIE